MFVIAYYVVVNAVGPIGTPVAPPEAPEIAPAQPAPVPPVTYP